MSTAGLDKFGELLTTRVRDQAIIEWDKIIDGRMKSPHAARVRDLLQPFTPEQREALHRLIPQIVDSTLHHLLWTLEQVEWIDVAVHTEAGTVGSIREASDGLGGDLWGWISRFSNERWEPDLYQG